MVEISLSGSGEGPGWVTAPGYSTAAFSVPPVSTLLTKCRRFWQGFLAPTTWLPSFSTARGCGSTNASNYASRILISIDGKSSFAVQREGGNDTRCFPSPRPLLCGISSTGPK